MTLNGFGKYTKSLIIIFCDCFNLGNGTVVDSHIPMDFIRRRKEQLKKEIQVCWIIFYMCNLILYRNLLGNS